MTTPLNCPIILASTSPRRVELLGHVGLAVSTMAPEADETPRKGEKPVALVKRLARDKALSVAERALWEHGMGIIIAADTIVVAPGGRTILGKPASPRDAARMLKLLAGRTHTVHTGYCLLACARGERMDVTVRVVTSKVTMRKLTPAMIEQYVLTGEPMDKAGAYAAQGLGMGLIERISGSYTNVVGLPLAQLLADLEKKFGISVFEREPERRSAPGGAAAAPA
jgi:septum formation protein